MGAWKVPKLCMQTFLWLNVDTISGLQTCNRQYFCWRFLTAVAVFAAFKLHVKHARESRKEEGRLCIPAAASREMSLELPGFNNVPHSTLKVTLSLQEWVSYTCNRGAERLETYAQIQTSWDLDLQSTNTPYPIQWVTPWISQSTHHRFNHRFKCGMTQKYLDKPTRFHKEWPSSWDRTQNL